MKRQISKELEEHFNKEHDFRNILKDINLKKDINSYEQLSVIEHIWVYGMTSLKPMAWVLSKANTQRKSTSLREGITAQKWSFPLRISSVNATRSAAYCGFEEIFNGKLHFLCSIFSNLHERLSVKWTQTPCKLFYSWLI